MFRGNHTGASAEDRLESLKRQYQPNSNNDSDDEANGGDPAGNNGLSLRLQDQYDQHDAEQAHHKRHRGAAASGGAGGDFAAAMGGMGAGAAGMGVNSSHSNNMGAGGTPGGAGSGMAGGMNGMGSPMMNAAGAGAMGAGHNNMAGAAGMNAAGMAGMNHHHAAMNAGMAGMNAMNMNAMGGMNMGSPMGGMNMANGMNAMNAGMGGMNAMNSMNAMGGMNMNGMNMNMAARAGMLGGGGGAAGGAAAGGGGLNPSQLSAMGAGMGAKNSDDLAAALYFQDSARMNMGLLGQRDPAGLGFMAAAQMQPFGEYGRLGMAAASQNPYAGLAGFPGAGGVGPGGPAGAAAAMGGMGGAANNARRAQLMALMDMENELQQQQEAAKAGGGGAGAAFPGGANDAWRGGGGARPGLPVDDQPTQIPEPPMDIPTFSTASTPSVLPLPPVIEEGAAPHFSQRAHIPLGIDEDNNWLTEFQCFIRFDLIEVVQASRHVDQMNATKGGSSSNNSGGGETFQQVGVRCRYCAHLHPGQRSSRSSAFPSSIRQLYQSFTMMLRDHFEQCSEIPPLRKKLFSELKAKNSQGAYDSKQYWIYAAEKLGMIDSEHGIQMTADSQAKARRKPPFGTVGTTKPANAPPKLLVSPEDIRITSDFLYTLMSQVQIVHLIDSERVGKRKTLRVGLPGFGCRYCCHVGRCGLSRMFPLRRRMLPGKVNEIYEHVKRCTLFPTKEKELLGRLKADDRTSAEQEKEFFDRIWERLGCESEVRGGK